jgi:hypothetical protein
MKRLVALNSCAVWLSLAVALILCASPAQAFVYDDFTSAGINASLWVDRGPNAGLFSQPGDGYLYFSDASGGQLDRLRSFNTVTGAFFVSMQYADFQAINDQPAGLGQGSAVTLRLGYSDIYVDMVEFKNASGLGFQAQANVGGTKIPLNYVYPGDIHNGWFGLYYNGILGAGGEVDFWYDYGAGWTLLDSYAPNFSEAPYFSILGYDQYGSSLSFRVGQVQLTPIPLPPALLLFGPGLLGLVAGRKRFIR